MVGQQCSFRLNGTVYDEGTQKPLSYVNVVVRELSLSTLTDDDGAFQFDGLCHDEYHLVFSHIGCQPLEQHVHLHEDDSITIFISHTSIELSDIVVEGDVAQVSTQPIVSISRSEIESKLHKNIGSILENETGVYALKTGSGVSKPIIHGLYGNRVTILNNRIPQSGQQWGNDHSPEIDPLSADKIQIVKGVGVLEYEGSSLGGLIIVEPYELSTEPHLHGQVNYAFESNGLGHNLHTRLGKYTPALAWKINATGKLSGDKSTPDYYLNNTGIREFNVSTQLEKNVDDKFLIQGYLSTFNTEIGILRGSHIGNTTDFENAIQAEIPLFTENNFSYKIDAPRQTVSHHLAKIQSTLYASKKHTFTSYLATQINNRKEYDVRRGGRSDKPALSLTQRSYHTGVESSHQLTENDFIKVGDQLSIIDNTNIPETDILPLIPDYIDFKNGLFVSYQRKLKSSLFNVGVRYNFSQQNVVAISQSIPRSIVRYNNTYHTFSGIASYEVQFDNKHMLNIQTGYATRNPAVNELYSNGLHQGVSGIEEGDVNLHIEKSSKSVIEYNWTPSTKFTFQSLAYFQRIQEYIFLNPTDEVRLTIRGAFPVFRYKQTQAQIAGLDAAVRFNITPSILAEVKYSYLNGTDRTNNTPLVFMPPNRVYSSVQYRYNKMISVSKKVQLNDTQFEISNRTVFEQGNLNSNQDFVVPPSTYSLFNAHASTTLLTQHHTFKLYLKAENILNTRYRDYLNRQRYFADELGVSIIVGAQFNF